MKIKFNTLEPFELTIGDKFEANLNSSAPKDEQPIIEISIISKDYIEVMIYKSEGRLLVVTDNEIKKMDVQTWVEKHTIKTPEGDVVWTK